MKPGWVTRHAVAPSKANLAVLQGVRSASSALTLISAHSSKNNTPRWARLTAPGRAIPEPPPTRAATLEL
ncbi:mg-chelatase subunits D/I, ComM subfamily domain protein [Mycobacterium kansasii]|uniref:Mg-chelatase subunits D/I, ComM subfamily domain protein n=1 Tax=Mycobacterium kansasii TaxID=1768 RepID=A0A1V3XTZ4_MYCKA|nr:mg-chelatase subunits D/I, ComM subfamily domain protein [Mycobacterium kansasii]